MLDKSPVSGPGRGPPSCNIGREAGRLFQGSECAKLSLRIWRMAGRVMGEVSLGGLPFLEVFKCLRMRVV